MVIGADHDAAKALVAGGGTVVLLLGDMHYQRQMGLFLQQPSVIERFAVDSRLFAQQGLRDR